MREIKFHTQAEKDLDYWQKHNPRYLEKIEQLLEAIQHNPFEGIGKPEPLQYNLQNYWSRRISEEHRIVYQIKDNAIHIHTCRGHYK